MATFHIRDEMHPGDADFILEAFDSTIPHLASIGSGTQWGTEPFSTRPGSAERLQAAVEKARSGTSDTDSVFIAEVSVDDGFDSAVGRSRRDKDNQQMLKVGAAITQGTFPPYVAEQPHLEAHVRAATQRADYIYLYALVSDFRVGALRKGAGAALTRRVRQYAREKGKAVVYLDCWAGDEEKLVKFYISQGFVPVDGFQVKKDDGSFWPGTLVRLNVDESISHE